jgi:hypothetical protein
MPIKGKQQVSLGNIAHADRMFEFNEMLEVGCEPTGKFA